MKERRGGVRWLGGGIVWSVWVFLEVQEAKKEMREVKALSTIAWSILFGQGPLYI